MTKYIFPGTAGGTAEAPPSKSMTHRLLIMSTMAAAAWRIERPLWSDDTKATLTALQQLGYRIQAQSGYIIVEPAHRTTPADGSRIDVGNSGTSARFLTALAATEEGMSIILDGSERMRQRPMRELLSALRTLGADIGDTNGGLPLRIHGKKLRGGSIEVDASRSSQFLSALLLIAPRLDTQLRIRCSGTIASEPYAHMTTGMMQSAGVVVRQDGPVFAAETGRPYTGTTWQVEGDYSGAAFLLAAAALTGGEVTVTSLAVPSLQGDAEIISVLRLLGARVEYTNGLLRVQGGVVRQVDIDMHSVPDLVPVTAVLCLFASGPSRLRNVAHLRFKESDRIQALIDNAARLGGNIICDNGDLVIEPGPLHGGVIDPLDDHRIAMSFAIAGLRVPDVVISSPECVDKSFPDFWSVFEQLTRQA